MPRILEPFKQFLDNNGDPLVSGWLRFLVSGTNNTDKDTYADVNETVANANPVQLDAAGRMPNVFGPGTYRVVSFTNDPVLNQPSTQVELFDNVGSGGDSEGVPAWDANTSYDKAAIVVADDMNFYRSLTNNNEGNDPTISATNWEQIEWESFYNPNRTYSQYDRVISDGISYQSLQGSNLGKTPSSSPLYWGFLIGSPLNSNDNQIQESKGADIASAATLILGNDGNTFNVTGTTDISAIQTTGRIGTMVRLTFNGSLDLVYDVADLILPGGDDITTAAGDVAIFEEYATGDWKCLSYTRANGQPVAAFPQNFTVVSTTGVTTASTSFVNGVGGALVFTPSEVGIKILLRATFQFEHSSAGFGAIVSTLALDGTPIGNPYVLKGDGGGSGLAAAQTLEWVYTSTDTAAHSFTVQIRTSSAAYNAISSLVVMTSREER